MKGKVEKTPIMVFPLPPTAHTRPSYQKRMYFVVAFMETFKQMEINKKPMQFHPPPLSQISRQKVALMYGVCVWLGGGGGR